MNASVIIPTYNGSRFIAGAMESVYAQTELPCEIIVVDDCSIDNTVEVVERLAVRSPLPVRIIRQPSNSGGPAEPINEGIEHAVGELIAVLDQDDSYTPQAIPLAARALRLSPSSTVAFHWAGTRDSGNSNLSYACHETVRAAIQTAANDGTTYKSIPGKHLLTCLLRYGNFLMGYPGFVFRRSDWLRKGGINKTFKIASDMDLLAWLFTAGNGILIPHIGYVRRIHQGNLTHRVSLMHLEMFRIQTQVAVACEGLDRDVVKAFADQLESAAYWYRKAHRFRESVELYQLRSTMSGSTLSWNLCVAKARIHQAISLLTRQPAKSSRWTNGAR